MTYNPVPVRPPKIERLSIKDWLKGTVTALDDGRSPTDGLKASGNMILEQDGVLRPRPSLVRYGIQPTGVILGEVFEFVKTVGSANLNYLITMQNVSGVTKIYTAIDGSAWTVANGKTYNNTALAHFVQVDNKVLIMNGIDNLSYLDIPTLAVTPFTTLATPAAPTATQTGLAGSAFTYYYQISANSTVGETAASPVGSAPVSTLRQQWTPATQFETLTWSAVTNALSYNVYLASVTGGTAYLIAAGITGLTYKDNGSAAVDVSRAAPLADTTAGPKTTRATVINGQVFMVGDRDNPRYVRYGGTGTSILDFSPFNGGGYTEIGQGTKEFPISVKPFRDGRGTAQITVLCRGTNGTGKRYLLTPNTVTVGTTVINFFDTTEDNGQDGTDSPDGVILYRDSLYYPSRDGFKTTGTKPQLQNLLSTDTISETIINDVKNLNNAAMNGCVGLAFQGRLYWSLPNGSTTNNEIWVLDLNRQGAWMKPWNIAASWMVLYNDNTTQSVTHHLILKNNVIYELSYSSVTSDDGVAFATNATSGNLKFSDDSLEWANVIDMTFILLRPQGQISFTVSGKTEEASIASVGSTSYTAATSIAGWGEAGWGGSPDAIPPQRPQIFGWSNFSVVPITLGSAQQQVTIEIDEILQYVTWELDTSAINCDYSLADVIVRFVRVGVLDIA